MTQGCLCGNARQTRFLVRMAAACDPNSKLTAYPLFSGIKFWKEITKASGLSLGSEGETDLDEFDATVKVPDGRLTFKSLSFDVASEDVYDVQKAFLSYLAWVDSRDEVCVDIFVDITNKAYETLYSLVFQGCTIKDLFDLPDKERKTATINQFSFSVNPYRPAIFIPAAPIPNAAAAAGRSIFYTP